MKPGRKRHDTPHERRTTYLATTSIAAVNEWIASDRGRKGRASFSQAINEMLEVASFFANDVSISDRYTELRRMLKGLHGGVPEHIAVEPNAGRKAWCRKCRTGTTLTARRFSGLLKELDRFVSAHKH